MAWARPDGLIQRSPNRFAAGTDEARALRVEDLPRSHGSKGLTMTLPDFKLATKLGAAFFTLVLLTAGLGAFAVRQMATINEHMEAIGDNILPGVEMIGKLRLTANLIRRAEADHVLLSLIHI